MAEETPTRQQRRRKAQKPDQADQPVRTVEVVIPGRTEKATFRRFNTRDFLALRRGNLSDVETIDMTLEAIIEYPGDPLDLPVEDLLAMTANWIAAMTEVAVPPQTA
jgi:hypothetical protein